MTIAAFLGGPASKNGYDAPERERSARWRTKSGAGCGPAHVEQPRVGAFRLIDARGKVIERVDEDEMTGMVQIGGEQWRAASSEIIEVGVRVVVTEIDGTRLVVAPSPQEKIAESIES